MNWLAGNCCILVDAGIPGYRISKFVYLSSDLLNKDGSVEKTKFSKKYLDFSLYNFKKGSKTKNMHKTYHHELTVFAF